MYKRKRKKQIVTVGFNRFLSVSKKIFKFIGKIFTLILFHNCFVSYALSPTGSMTPTYLSGDVFIVAYDFNLQNFLPTSLETKSSNLNQIYKKVHNKLAKPLFKTEFERGDVIAFKVDSFEYILSKRIIAVGGDTLEVKNGVIYINDQPLTLTYKGEYFKKINNKNIDGHLYEENNNGVKYDVLYKYPLDAKISVNHIQKRTVPQNHFVMIGDNRHRSSHFNELFSFVPRENIIGRIVGSLFYCGHRSLNLYKVLKSIDPKRFLFMHKNR